VRIKSLTPEGMAAIRSSLLAFCRKYGDRRITHRALRWFYRLPYTRWAEGTLVAIATEGQRLIGVIAFGCYGLEESFIVVHPDHRNRRIGEILLNHALKSLKKVYTRVACDNIPSLKLCFSCGLVAFRLIRGPTGKPTLCLAGGNWNAEEVPWGQTA
jgi:GNAT superfamily N-acetyltransferase